MICCCCWVFILIYIINYLFILLQVQWEKEIDIKLLVDCTHLSKDGVTRNHVYSLISSVAKFIPEKLVEHMLDILTLIGESAVRQVIKICNPEGISY